MSAVSSILRGSCVACLFVALLGARVSAQSQPLAPPQPPDEESDAEVFARVFKKTADAEHIPASLVIGDSVRGTITLDVPGRSLLVSASQILIAVGPSLRMEARKRLVAVTREESTCEGRRRFDPRAGQRHADAVRKVVGKALGKDAQFLTRCDAAISIDALRRGGLDIAYDPTRLELRIQIRPQQQQSLSHDLDGAPASAADARGPSALSGYFNFRASGGHEVSTGSLMTAREPLRLDVDALLNARGWVVEGKVGVGEPPIADAGDGRIAVHRGDVRLLHDDPSRALRFMVGDVAVPVGGLQPSYPIAGISLSRNYSLQPYRHLQPVGTFDFVLERNAKVTVLVNNTPVQTLNLTAGRHDVRDLRLDGGVNDIELLVRDEAGVERRIVFSTASAEELLAPGLAQFSLDIGFPLIADLGLRSYDFSRPVIAARRRWGVSSFLTAGASFDATLDQQIAGAALAVASTRGNVSIEVAASSTSEEPFRLGPLGVAERLRYHFQRSVPGQTTSSFTAVLGHYSPDFGALDTMPALATAPAGRYSDDLAVSILRGLPRRITGSLSLRYQIGRNGPDAQDASISAARAFGSFNVSASMSVRGDGTGPVEKRCFISTHWVLPEGRGTLRSTTAKSSQLDPTNEIVYSKRSAKNGGGVGASIGAREGADGYAVTASADYTGYRFTSAVSTTTSVASGGGVSQTTAAELATALVFAGGRMTWSRPISGSFVIVAANETIRGQKIGVNPAAGGYASEDNSLGLAVVSNLDAYRVGTVRVEAPSLPLGLSLGPSTYSVLPTYKSGTLIVVGEAGTVFVRGTLQRADGTPIALASGELKSLDDPTQLSPTLMTNGTGRLSTPGLTPGRYAIQIAGETVGAEIVIPANARGVFDLGVVRLK